MIFFDDVFLAIVENNSNDWIVLNAFDIPMIKDIKSFGNKLTLPIASALRKRFESTFYQITSAFVDTTRKTPLGVNDWSTHLDDDGRLMNPKDLWVIVFNWGIEPQLRQDVWKHLLNVFPPDLTQTEREKFLAMKCKVRKCCKFLWYLGGGDFYISTSRYSKIPRCTGKC